MGAFITERPEKTVSGNVSRWNAVTNPVIFTVERRDFDILGVTDDNGFIQITMINVNDLDLFNLVVGDRIYIRSGQYDTSGEITDLSTPGSFTLDIQFSSNSTGGYINLLTKRTNYRLQVRILKVVNNLYVPIVTTGQFRTDEKGIANIDISAWLRTLPRMINEYDYVALNEADPNLGGNYIFQVKELFTDPQSGPSDAKFGNPAFENLNFFVNAARQLQSEHGGNMAQFVPFNQDVDESKKALFLSDFVEPSRFAGFPFDLQFINSDNVSDRFVEKQERSFNINSVLKDSNSDLLDNGQNTAVNRLRLEEGYDQEAVSLDVWLSFDTSVKELFGYAEPDAIDEDYDEDDFASPPPTPPQPKGPSAAL